MTLHSLPLRAAGAPAASDGAFELRRARPADAAAVAQVTHRAFLSFHESRGVQPDFPSFEAALGLISALLADPQTFGVVAMRDDRIIGANFLTEGDPIRGVGPIAVDPEHQDTGIGRALMLATIARGGDALGIRLVQDAFNEKTMALYTALGFDPREPLAVLTGTPRDRPAAGMQLRPMTAGDLPAAARLCRRVHGFPRTADLQSALGRGTPVVLERAGRLAAYMTTPALWLTNHAVAEDEEALRALILGAGAAGTAPLGFLLPIRRAGLLRWCLGQGLRVVKPMTLMSHGHYADPEGAWLPSVMY